MFVSKLPYFGIYEKCFIWLSLNILCFCSLMLLSGKHVTFLWQVRSVDYNEGTASLLLVAAHLSYRQRMKCLLLQTQVHNKKGMSWKTLPRGDGTSLIIYFLFEYHKRGEKVFFKVPNTIFMQCLSPEFTLLSSITIF